MTEAVVILLLNLILSSLGAVYVIHRGRKLGLMDLPKDRSSHIVPTPKGGGIGILIAFIITGIHLDLPTWIWAPAALLSMVSLWGDRMEIGPRYRLALQFACAIAFLLGWNTNGLGWILLIPLAVFLVGTCNFYNFMDGINGIAAGTGAVAFGFLSLWGILTSVPLHYVVASGAIALGCVGFIPFNVPKARVFMGDVGSILLGFLFGVFTLLFINTPSDIIPLTGFLFPFYADSLSTLLLRTWRGEKLSSPHRRHLYQVLSNERGIAHWKVSMGYCALQICVASGGLTLGSDLRAALIFFTFCFLIFCSISFKIRTRRTRIHIRRP